MTRITLTLSLMFSAVMMGQSQDQDFLESSLSSVHERYRQQFPQPVFLHTGPEYVFYDVGINGHPFFPDEDFSMGSAIVKGRRFPEVSLLYDAYKDKLVIEHFNAFNYFEWLEVVPEKVDSFTVYGYQFFRVDDKSEFSGQLAGGFYNLLFNGTVRVISKRNKVYYEEINDRRVSREFQQKDKFYIVKDGSVVQVRSKGGVWRVFKDKKKPLKAAMKAEGIKFKSQFEFALVRAAQIYDKIEGGL